MTAELSGPFCYAISEYVKTEQDDHGIGVWTEYQIEDGATVIARGIADRAIAEDIAALPILKRELERLSGLVPVRRSEDNRLESVCQLLEELLAEVKRGNAAERTGSVSSVQIEDFPTKDRPVRISTKHYVGSPLTIETINEQLAAHAYAHRCAEEQATNGWAVTLASVRNEAAS